MKSKKFNFADQIHKFIGEAFMLSACIVCLIIAMQNALLLGTSTIGHDHLYWYSPIFSFFAEGLLQGEFRLWNPFSHGGEPLLPAYLQLKMLDPIPILTIFFGKSFTTDLITLSNWAAVTGALISSLGTYLFLRRWTHSSIVRFALAPPVFLSAILINSFSTPGIADQYYMAPILAIFLFRILQDRDWRWINWVFFGVAYGLTFQSYFFVGSTIFVIFVIVGFLIFRTSDVANLIKEKLNWVKLFTTVLILAAMAAPMIALLQDINLYVFPARGYPENALPLLPQGGPFQYDTGDMTNGLDAIFMPYSLIWITGTFSQPVDFLGILAPAALFFPEASEAELFIGTLSFSLALYGMIACQNNVKPIMFLLLGGFTLLSLGPLGWVHWALYQIFPPLWVLRHTHQLSGFILLVILYFFVIGGERFVLCINDRHFFTQSDKKGLAGRLGIPTTIVSPIVTTICLFILVFIGYSIMKWQPKSINVVPTIPIWLLLASALLYVFRNDIRQSGMFTVLLGSLAILALINTSNLTETLMGHTWLLLLPLACAAFSVHRKWRLLRYLPMIGAILIFFELSGYVFHSSKSWNVARPDTFLSTVSTPTMAQYPPIRRMLPTITSESFTAYPQSIRYLELLTREVTAFDLPKRLPNLFTTDIDIASVLDEPRWNHFFSLVGYRNILSSNLPKGAVRNILSIGQPLVHFRTTLTPAKDFPRSIANLDPDEIIERLQDTIFSEQNEITPIETERQNQIPAISVLDYDYSSIIIVIQTEESGYLYFSDGYDPYWKALVNGKRRTIIQANGNFKAVQIGPGKNIVRFYYDPIHVKVAIAIFYGVVSLAIFFFLISNLLRILKRVENTGVF